MKRKRAGPTYAVCIHNDGYEVSLKLHKPYEVLPDFYAERHQLLRVIDESGDSYLYPTTFFASHRLSRIE